MPEGVREDGPSRIESVTGSSEEMAPRGHDSAPEIAIEQEGSAEKGNPFAAEEVIVLTEGSASNLKARDFDGREHNLGILDASAEDVGRFTANSGSIAFVPRLGVYCLVSDIEGNREAIKAAGYTSGFLGVIPNDGFTELVGNPQIEAQFRYQRAQNELESSRKALKHYFPES